MGAPLYAQQVVVSHGPYGGAGPLYRFEAVSPFGFIDSSEAYGRLVNHVRYLDGYLYSVASQADFIYIHDTSLVLIDSVAVDSGANLWMGDYTPDGRAFVAEYLLNRIAAYDLNSKVKLWETDVNLSPTYVGLYGSTLLVVSSGYDMGSYTSGPSTLYLLDTATGQILDSVRVGTNMLAAHPWGGDTILVVGGDYFDAATQKAYILTYSGGFSVVDSVSTPTSLSFIGYVSGDTALVSGYGYVGFFVLSSRSFLDFAYGSHVGFAGGVAYGDYVFVPAAEDYTSPGNLLVFNRSTLSLEATQTLSVSPSSITLIPPAVGISEREVVLHEIEGRIYDVAGRRLPGKDGRGVIFVVGDGKVRKVLRF
ncbi:MAG: hypothetical protein GXO29_04910 [Thermotogae bacterium]|nr:hypothetical protein [Thermotogota bacterium]